MRIRTISEELKSEFGGKVLKLSLSSGCTCPVRDGTKGTGGCSFCSEGGSGEFAAAISPIRDQILEAKKRVDAKFPKQMPESDRKYIAYFQSFTNTYGDPEKLGALFRETASQPGIVILSIGTRPDCLPDEMIRILADINRSCKVWVELGLQTIHEKTAEAFGRGYELPVFEDAYRRLKEAGLTVIVHMILGLPGEKREDMLSSIRYLSDLKPGLDGVKLQMLQILKGTRMAEQYAEAPFPMMTMETYTDLVVECLSLLPPGITVHRMTGDPPRKLLIAPDWTTDKKRVLNMLRRKINEA